MDRTDCLRIFALLETTARYLSAPRFDDQPALRQPALRHTVIERNGLFSDPFPVVVLVRTANGDAVVRVSEEDEPQIVAFRDEYVLHEFCERRFRGLGRCEDKYTGCTVDLRLLFAISKMDAIFFY